MKKINSILLAITLMAMFIFPQNVTAIHDTELQQQSSSILVWKIRPNMPTARYSTSAVVSNNKIFVIGGDNWSCTPLNNVEEYDPTTNAWSIRAGMPTGRWGLGAATGPDGKIYTFGGWGGSCGSDLLDTVEVYDPAIDSWDVRASMPTQRYGFGVAAATNGKIYVFGGENSTGMLATVEEYDPLTGTWASKADMPHPRKSFTTTAASNGKVYLLGGDPVAEELQEYDPVTDSWTSRAMIATTRYGVQMAQGSDGNIFAIGGVSVGDEFLNTVESYDPLTDTWRTETSIKTPRSGHVVVAVDQYIFAIGGGGRDPDGNFTPLNLVEAASVTGLEVNLPPVADAGGPYTTHDGEPITLDASGSYDYDEDLLTYEWDLDNDGQYDDAIGVTTDVTFIEYGTFTAGLRVIDTGGLSDIDTTYITNSPLLKWMIRSSMPTARYNMGAAVSNNKIYVIGGDNWSCTPLTNVEEYDPTTNAWSIRASMPTGRWGLSAATGPDGKIYAFGGVGGDCGADLLDTVEVYDPATDSWDVRASIPTPRSGFGVATATNGKIYVFGGENSSGWLATVEEYDPTTDAWVSKADMPYANKNFAITVGSNDKIYLLGGDTSTESLLEYDPTTDSYTSRATIPTARYGVKMAQGSDGRIFAIGGVSFWDEFQDTVSSYDPLTDTWGSETSLKTPRSGHVVVAVDDYIYAIGGASTWPDGNFKPLSSIEATNVLGLSALTLKGFYQPVDMNGVLNVAKGGSTIPFKFEVFAGATELTDTAYITGFTYTPVACDSTAPFDVIETAVTGSTSLRYDVASGQFIYNWKTPKLPGRCLRVTMVTQDGSSLVAYFKLK